MMPDAQGRILIIDDDTGVVRILTRIITALGLEAAQAQTLTLGLDKAFSDHFDIILLDVRLPDGNGLDAVETLTGLPNGPAVIIMTAFSDPDAAALAIENGAWDYIRKPASPRAVELQILRALQYQDQKRACGLALVFDPGRIIGSSPQIRATLTHAAQIANSDAHVLITGETGTGKELFARAIHDNSARRHNPFVIVDCSILSGTLFESVLFGHEKGAYTGADRARDGLALLAHGGTLFLDEIGELPESIQAAFLRMIQEKRFRPVGSNQEIYSDFRVISATNKELTRLTETGGFRTDLLYRLNSLTLTLPPLRSRDGDVPGITAYFLKDREFSDDFLEVLTRYDWPGNVRELMNVLDACRATAGSEKILFAYHLPAWLRSRVTRDAICKESGDPEPADTPDTTASVTPESFKDVMTRMEKDYLSNLFCHTRGDIQKMGDISGISRAVLYRKLKTHRIR